MTSLVPAPITLKNIPVMVSPDPEKPGKYIVVTPGPIPVITDQDTILSYQIIDTDGYPIVFKGMSVKPQDNNQLSPATVSLDGKVLAFVDANTVKMTLNVTLKFTDKDGVEFSHDPQVDNDPQ